MTVPDGPVGPTNEPPVASFNAVVTDFLVAFDAAASADPDGTITSHEWDFGDGSTASGVTASHTYESEGTFVVVLRVTDDDGESDSISRTVTVPNGPIGPPVEPPEDGGVGGQTSIVVLAGVAAVIAYAYVQTR